jgi:hypothetical protein
MRLTWLACTVPLTAAAPNGCRNECDFVERCQGSLRQVCGGVDQWVGRTVSEEPCVAPNGVLGEPVAAPPRGTTVDL